jgi:arylsulfatase A-like enzyme
MAEPWNIRTADGVQLGTLDSAAARLLTFEGPGGMTAGLSVSRAQAWKATQNVLARLLIFSPEGRLFFYATVLLHVALKMLLGLNAVLHDDYGFRSLLAPPQSFLLAAGDIGVCFLLTRLIDWATSARFFGARARRVVFTSLLWITAVFLGANFIVHGYFRSFINRGLIDFNGAPPSELMDYAVAGSNLLSQLFIAFALLIAAAVSILHSRLLLARAIQRPWWPVFGMLLNVASMAYISQLNQGQVGFMALNPGYILFMSYRGLGSGSTEIPRATAEEARRFVEPGPIFGKYDTALDVTELRRPRANVLLVLVESLPLEQTPLGGTPGGLTVLDELAENAINFDNFRSVFPATSRSFLTFHCGIYPSVGPSTATRYLPEYRCESFVPLLKKAGYRTGFFTAPMFNYDNVAKSPVVTDYDRFEDFLTLKNETHEIAAPAVPEEVVVDALLDFVSKDRERPFFATYFMFWNHAPYRLPSQDISHLQPLQRYRRTLEYLNEVLRDALSRMRQQGLLDDTVVIVTADHGEGFALHHDNVNHAGHIYEDDVKVPFLIHVPGLGRHATRRQGSNVDFAPTLAALLQLPRLPSWQGQDLLSKDFSPRPTLLYGRASFATIGLVDGNYKYINYWGQGTTALYDLEQDPFEQTNLLAQLPGHAERYRSLLQQWLPVVDQRSWAVNEP